jgi:hypothetical protein
MDFEEWMRYGIEAGFCGPPVCETHDGTPTSEEEDHEFDDGSDPCIHVVRLYEDEKKKAAVEKSHGPSTWRNHYNAVNVDKDAEFVGNLRSAMIEEYEKLQASKADVADESTQMFTTHKAQDET